MTDDPRCCGSGTCIIDAEGRCWCGQQWDGLKMSHAPLAPTTATAPTAPEATPTRPHPPAEGAA
ncbi:MAG TPA: hypothetical protein VET87_20980 [Rubrivivax sp.]|jgi:hypothetical protein|nr:hypothetical protein [Rubrivivax sp.]